MASSVLVRCLKNIENLHLQYPSWARILILCWIFELSSVSFIYVAMYTLVHTLVLKFYAINAGGLDLASREDLTPGT